MSYDISIIDPVTRATLTGERHEIHGITYSLGGTNLLWTNETYNYRKYFVKALGDDGVFSLKGLQAATAIPLIQKGVQKLGDDVDDNYYKATEGNVKRALYRVLALCKMRPDGIVEVN